MRIALISLTLTCVLVSTSIALSEPYGGISIRPSGPFTPPIRDSTCRCVRAPCPCATCPRLQCDKNCEVLGGWEIDSFNCNTCQCKEKEPCPLIKCATSCGTLGFKKDKNGCQTCQCNDPKQCRRFSPRCWRRCPNGYALDVDGCKTCRCNPEPTVTTPAPTTKRCLAAPLCRKFCKNGFVQDADGCFQACPPCKPDPPRCGPVCAIFCENGNVLDEDGCPTCRCNAAPTETPPTSGVCPNLPPGTVGACAEFCDRSNPTTSCPAGQLCCSNGCGSSCQRAVLPKPEPICPDVCDIFCEFGNVLDKNGCKTCQCKPDPSPVEPPRCGPVCFIFCEFGNVPDENGCPTCRCNPEPTETPPTAGVCPTLLPGTVGLCAEFCDRSNPSTSCPAGQLCCSNGCGSSCQRAVLPTVPTPISKPGTCPDRRRPSVITGPIPSCNDDDSNCPGNEKCCSVIPGAIFNGNSACFDPVFTSGGGY